MSTIDFTPPAVSVTVLEIDAGERTEWEDETAGQANYVYKISPAAGDWIGIVFDREGRWAIAPTGGMRYDVTFADKDTAMWFFVTMIDYVNFECCP